MIGAELRFAGALDGLEPLRPADLPRYKAALDLGQQVGWGYYFSYLLSRNRPGRSAVLLAEDEGSMCVFLWRLRDTEPRLDLCVAPTPMTPGVLRRCLERANDFNGDRSARVLRMDEKDVESASSLPALRVLERKKQYIYAPERYTDLQGSKYYTIRRNVAIVESSRDVEVAPYVASHAEGCRTLLRRWRAHHRETQGTAGGYGMSRLAIELAFELPDSELRGEVVFLDGTLSAFAFGGELRPGFGCSFDRRSDPGIRGLSYFQFRSFLTGLREFPLVTDGSDAGRSGLRQIKDSFRPADMYTEYRAVQRK